MNGRVEMSLSMLYHRWMEFNLNVYCLYSLWFHWGSTSKHSCNVLNIHEKQFCSCKCLFYYHRLILQSNLPRPFITNDSEEYMHLESFKTTCTCPWKIHLNTCNENIIGDIYNKESRSSPFCCKTKRHLRSEQDSDFIDAQYILPHHSHTIVVGVDKRDFTNKKKM